MEARGAARHAPHAPEPHPACIPVKPEPASTALRAAPVRKHKRDRRLTGYFPQRSPTHIAKCLWEISRSYCICPHSISWR